MSETIDLLVDELAAGGDGVGRDASGRVVFVPYTVPGDRVIARITEERKSFARGEVVKLQAAGASRIEAPCKLYRDRRCGGCQWQNVAVDEQRRAKWQIASTALRKLSEAGMVFDEIDAPVPTLGWRRRARLHWFRAPSARSAVIGFFAPRSQFVTDTEGCVQLTSALDASLKPIRKHLARSLYGRGSIHLVESADGVHVALDGAARPGAAEALAAEDSIAGVRVGHRVFGNAAVVVDGASGGAEQFAQASEAGNRRLVEIVEGATASWRQGARVLELYAGAGNLTRALSGAEVVAVERESRETAMPNVSWRIGEVGSVVDALIAEKASFDGILLDPPRRGAKEIASKLGMFAAKHIVYVSCDPATLSRDAAAIVNQGFVPVRATPVDLMPQTCHVEVVALFSRAAAAP